jgi:F0F1-type ATP synthase membrane subunit b/b'
MKTFLQFVENRRISLLNSIDYIGQHLNEAEEILNTPEAQPAVEFIQKLADQIANSAKTGIEFITSLATKPVQEISQILKSTLSDIETKFNKASQSLQQKKQQHSESIVGDVGSFAFKGLQFLIEKLLWPPLKLVMNSIKNTAYHVLASTVDAGKNMGVQGFLGMVMAVALTVAVWPVFATISVMALGTTGTTWAVGGSMFSIWLCMLAMAWFKANVLGPALMKGEGINPPGGVAYGI